MTQINTEHIHSQNALWQVLTAMFIMCQISLLRQVIILCFVCHLVTACFPQPPYLSFSLKCSAGCQRFFFSLSNTPREYLFFIPENIFSLVFLMFFKFSKNLFCFSCHFDFICFIYFKTHFSVAFSFYFICLLL